MSELILYSKISELWFVEQYENLTLLLNDLDKQRFDKMKSQLKRKQLVLSRFLLQQAVLELLNEDKHSIQSYHIENYHQLIINQQYHFSISITHSGPIAAVCVSKRQLKLGIDVEKIKPRNFIELSAEICTLNELTRIKAGQYQPVSFYQLWTVKEALTKATAANLRDSFSFDCSPVLKKNYGVIILAKEPFAYNTISLSHESDSFVGTVVVELLDYNRSNNNISETTCNKNSAISWQYYTS
ncbi:4'-phosphopantetheinyl transferase family protein [Pseudocolwellia sp. HL-MZ19]|uniref:4'-phosphopantetheinyl transferase family protein n=1 Tax=unclassified Pseudocolwellia TaxID=2848178 RepID=UPI003CF5B294